MRIGNNKTKMRTSMKEFIMSTLNKNKAECYVVKKGGNVGVKQQPGYTVNERGHLVNPNTLEPISTKTIKSSSTVKEKQHPAPSVNNSTKNI